MHKGEYTMIYQKISDALTPITAQPFRSGYMEYSPCSALKPYIRCFWTGINQSGRLIVPDLCADIIFDIDNNEAFFCGVSDESFVSDRLTATFGIRFYAWTVALFAEDSLHKTLNGGFLLGEHFRRLEKDLASKITYAKTTEQRIALSEKYLINNLNERNCGLFLNAIGEILNHKGACTAADISKKLHVSNRQLERVFSEYSGLTPKKAAMLIRYQYLWRDILSGQCFSGTEKAAEYGYSDQSHLLKDFRKFHTVYPKQAREIALNNVAFLQDNPLIK